MRLAAVSTNEWCNHYLYHVKEHITNCIGCVHVDRDCTKFVFIDMKDRHVLRICGVNCRSELWGKEHEDEMAHIYHLVKATSLPLDFE